MVNSYLFFIYMNISFQEPPKPEPSAADKVKEEPKEAGDKEINPFVVNYLLFLHLSLSVSLFLTQRIRWRRGQGCRRQGEQSFYGKLSFHSLSFSLSLSTNSYTTACLVYLYLPFPRLWTYPLHTFIYLFIYYFQTGEKPRIMFSYVDAEIKKELNHLLTVSLSCLFITLAWLMLTKRDGARLTKAEWSQYLIMSRLKRSSFMWSAGTLSFQDIDSF